MVLNLDTHFAPLSHLTPLSFESFTFSGGEPHIKINPVNLASEPVWITHRIRSFSDIGLLMLAVDALRRMGVSQLRAFLPYFPGARQDRVMVSGEPLTVKVYADLINQLSLDQVYVFDPHSEVTPALLNSCYTLSNHAFIQQVVSQLSSSCTLIAPDGGSLKKIYSLATFLGQQEVVECSKVRDVKSGNLSGFRVYADGLEGKDCLIVDDICDGGGTFIGLAQELKKKGAGNLYLAVSHGIFSKGFKELTQHFAQIFTTDSFSTLPETMGLVQFPLASLELYDSAPFNFTPLTKCS